MTPGLTTQFCGEPAELNREPLRAALVSAAGHLNVVATAVGASRSPTIGHLSAAVAAGRTPNGTGRPLTGLGGQTTLDPLFDAAIPQEAALG